MPKNNVASLTRLRWQGLLVTAFYAVGITLFYNYLRQIWPSGAAEWWLSLTVVSTIVQMIIFWWGLRFNHPPNRMTLFPQLGYANSMTLTRGLLTCLLAGFLFNPQPSGSLTWMPALLYTCERLLDYFDGFVARITERETKLGTILDMEFDGLGLLIAVGLAIQYDKLPVWYLVLGLGRQLFVLGMWIRQRWHKPNYDLPPSDHRRLIAGFQTTFISVTLWPTLSNQVSLFAGYLFALPLIFSFGRDWLVVSGVMDGNSAWYHAARRQIKTVVEGWLPLLLRVTMAIVTLFLLNTEPVIRASLWLLISWIVAILALTFGIVGRVAALMLIALLAMAMSQNGLHPANLFLLSGAILILHLGSGRLALWTPEEGFLHRKLGEKQVSQ